MFLKKTDKAMRETLSFKRTIEMKTENIERNVLKETTCVCKKHKRN